MAKKSICRTCGVRHVSTKNDILKCDYQCVKCRREYAMQYRIKRKMEGRPVKTGVMSKEYHLAYSKKYFAIDKNRKRRNETQRQRAKKPDAYWKNKVRRIVRSQIEAGKLKRIPCKVCGNPRSQAHHDDYNKPLKVKWLCAQHHSELHVKAKAKGEA